MAGRGADLSSWHTIVTETGVSVPLLRTDTNVDSGALLILLPALGIRASFYRKLASGLAENGVSSVVVEQRGNGESSYRPGRQHAFTLCDYLREDIDAVTVWCQQQFPDRPIYIGGHSLGGHMASIAAGENPKAYDGIVHLACGFPYHKDFRQPASGFVKLLIAIIPGLTAVIGYYPGQWFKFGGREFRGLMMDWRNWARFGRYAVNGIEDADDKVAAYAGRALSIAFEKDSLATNDAIERSRRALSGARLTRLKLGKEEQGEFLGHVDWGKRPVGVVQALSRWLGS